MSQEAIIINTALLISVILFAIRLGKYQKRLIAVEKKIGIKPEEEIEAEENLKKIGSRLLKEGLKNPYRKKKDKPEVKSHE